MKFIYEGSEKWVLATVPYTANILPNFKAIKGTGEKNYLVVNFSGVDVRIYKQKDTYVFKEVK